MGVGGGGGGGGGGGVAMEITGQFQQLKLLVFLFDFSTWCLAHHQRFHRTLFAYVEGVMVTDCNHLGAVGGGRG